MNILLLTPRDITEVVLKRKWWELSSITTCTTQAFEGQGIFSEVVQINHHSGECLTKRLLAKSPVSIEMLSR